jgi:hypothetical protein
MPCFFDLYCHNPLPPGGGKSARALNSGALGGFEPPSSKGSLKNRVMQNRFAVRERRNAYNHAGRGGGQNTGAQIGVHRPKGDCAIHIHSQHEYCTDNMKILLK